MTEPVRPLEALKRYDLVLTGSGYYTSNEMERSDDGEWVRFDELAALLQAAAPPAPTAEHQETKHVEEVGSLSEAHRADADAGQVEAGGGDSGKDQRRGHGAGDHQSGGGAFDVRATCWIVTDYEGGGIRGVFQSQRDAEAEIAAICADHEDLTRKDFIIGTYRVRSSAATPERVSEGKEPAVPYTTPCVVAWPHTPLQFDWQCAVCGKLIAAASPAVEPREEPR